MDDKTIAKAFSRLEKRFNHVLHTKTSWSNSPTFRCVCSIEHCIREDSSSSGDVLYKDTSKQQLSLSLWPAVSFYNIVNIDGQQNTPIYVKFNISKNKHYITLRMCKTPELKMKFMKTWIKNVIGKNVFMFKYKVLDEYDTIESLAIEHDFKLAM